MEIILASASPRRAELLKQIDIDFKVVTAGINEEYEEGMPAFQVVYELAARKAEAVFDKLLPTEDTVIIASDTVVSLDDNILGKPIGREGAYDMLKSLSGRSHSVYTGVSIYYYCNKKIKVDTFVEETKVYFDDMSHEEIKQYIATGEPFDKAGAYGIQGYAAKYISKIEGDYYTVVGLPLRKVYRSLKENGICC
ncbi:MAG: septum formation protein Maf [Firmicutes bacterium]|nr:septum formation protein Maf [Bacillota bacterium]